VLPVDDFCDYFSVRQPNFIAMKPLQLLFLCVFSMCMGLLPAQTFTVTGYVYSGDHRRPAFGARVIHEGVGELAFTDREGAFSITTSSESGTLIVDFVGHEDLRVEFGPENYTLVIRLKPAPPVVAMKEVVKDSTSDTLKSPGVYISPEAFDRIFYKDPRIQAPSPYPPFPPRNTPPGIDH
jgi:hypothetical protein